MRAKKILSILTAGVLCACAFLTAGCGASILKPESSAEESSAVPEDSVIIYSTEENAEAPEQETSSEKESAEPAETENSSGTEMAEAESSSAPEPAAVPVITSEPLEQPQEAREILFDPDWEFGEFSKINTGAATLYYAAPDISKGVTVCINAGHGTKGGSSVKTQCHPDGTPKVTGGTTSEGALEAVAVSTGTDLADGTPEAEATLALAKIVKDRLLADGYNVLMIREEEDVQLDNIARTLMANAYADCHIALHYDGTESDVGAFFMSVPSESSYREMYPVSEHWQEHNLLGSSIIEGLRSAEVKIMGEGSIEMDLTQTSYSTVPSIDLEVGDKVSDRSQETLDKLAAGISQGLDIFFKK